MGTRAPVGEMIRIEVADLARELRMALIGRNGRCGAGVEPDVMPHAASNRDGPSRSEWRLRLVTPDQRDGCER